MSKDNSMQNGIKASLDLMRAMTLTRTNTIPRQGSDHQQQHPLFDDGRDDVISLVTALPSATVPKEQHSGLPNSVQATPSQTSSQSPVSNTRSPVSTPQLPDSILQSPVSNLQSSVPNLQSPVSNLQSPVSIVQYPVSNLKAPLSKLQSPVSNFQSPLSNPQSLAPNHQSPIIPNQLDTADGGLGSGSLPSYKPLVFHYQKRTGKPLPKSHSKPDIHLPSSGSRSSLRSPSFWSKSELPVPRTLTKPELPIPTTLAKTEIPIPATLAKPELPIPTTLAKPERPIPSTLTRPELPKPSTLNRPELPKPSTLNRPELPIPSTLNRPELPKPSTLNRPELPIPSTLNRPELPKPRTLNRPELPKPSTLNRPELPIPSTLNRPELPIPSTLNRPELPIPSTLNRPELPIPSTLNRPALPIPTTLAKPELPIPRTLTRPELPIPTTLAKPELPISTTHTKPQLFFPSTHSNPDLPIQSTRTKPDLPLPINSIKHDVPLSSADIKTGIPLSSNGTRLELSLPNTRTNPEFPLTITKPEIPLPRTLTKPEIPLANTLSKPEIPLLSTSIKHEVPLPSARTKPDIRSSSRPTRIKQDLLLPSPQCKLDLHLPLCDSSSSLPLGQPLPAKRHSYVVFDPRLLEPQPLTPYQSADDFKIPPPPKSDTSPNLPLLIAQTPSTEDLLDTSASDRDSNTDSSSGSENSLKLIKRLGSTGSRSRHLVPPKDFRANKTKSESALSCSTFPAVTDPRTNSSHSNLVPPNDLISSNPRRDSAWTAEVLSMEIQVDYVMDPAELWGSEILNKPSSKDVSECGDMTEDSPTIPVTITSGDAPDQMDTTVPIPPGPEETKKPEEKEPTKDNTSRSRESIQLNLPPREHWENRFQFLLSTIGYAVDLSNVWRFPFLCYKNGGGAFLIPYFTTLIFGAMPVFFMEMCLGQFNRCGPTAIWEKMSPMFKGIGIASCFMAYIVAFYYNVIIGWSFFYLFASFTYRLPWTSCFNAFNSDNCWQLNWDTNTTNGTSDVGAADQIDADAKPWNRTYNVSTSLSSTMEFFERGMLELNYSTGLDDLGVVRWQLALCTFLTFTVLYFCLWKGVKSTGKVVYITATLPYVIMTILLVRGVLLPGAEDGIRYFITPKIDSLRKPKVWIDAAVQIFFSVGSGFGTHIAYASYNKFHNDCKRDCVITVIVNSLTSLFSGFVIFSYLGYMALKTHKDIDKVATEGPGLVFIVYPEAIATLPGSVGWAIIFFFMLLSLGLDSAFGGLESPLTGIRDELSQLMKYKYFREVLTLIIIMSAFIFSIPCLMQGGMYIFTMLDTFAAGTSIVFIVLCEVVAVSWIYGMPQFCADVEKMTGHKPSIFWRICWKFICPCLLTVIVASSIISYQPLTYRTSLTTYTYPYYANIVGWCIATSSMVMVPGYIVYKLIRTKGSFKQRIALCISPAREHEEIQQKGIVKRFQRSHWLSL